MERSQFTFYESFFRALKRIRKKADRADAYDAICDYALNGVLPDLDAMPDAAAIAFDLIRPNLDSAKRKSDGGKKSKTSSEDNGKITARYEKDASKEKEKEIEKEKENEIEVENECYPQSPLRRDPAIAAVMTAYLNKINPSASQTSLDELSGYTKAMGPDVCLRAIDVALDAKKATWPYIRGILRRLEGQGVKCLADWDALEASRGQKKSGRANANNREGFSPGESEIQAIADLERLRDALREDTEGG